MEIMKGAWFLSAALFLCFSLKTHLSIATDNIASGQSLTGNQTIVSRGGVYELGFFTPGNSSYNYYIGIWYKKISIQSVVWVDNRDEPLTDPSSSELRISEDGNLVLLNQSKFPIWSTNLSSAISVSTEAVLLESGNFVLRSSSAIFWQSFDHPTDSWLPGGKVIYRRKGSKEKQMFISWRNREDPSPGRYSFDVDPSGSYQSLLVWKRSITYWRSGTWNGQFFGAIPEMMPGNLLNFSFITTKNESYFTWTLYNNSIMSRMVLDVTGQIKQILWFEEEKQWFTIWAKPLQKCQVHAICGAFGLCKEGFDCRCLQGFEPRSPKDWNLSDWSGGCIRKIPFQCENHSSVGEEKYSFLQISNVRLPKNRQELALGNAKDCKLVCLNKCSCNAYAFRGGQCLVWDGDLLNLEQLSVGDSDGEDLYVQVAASELQNYGAKKRKSATRTIVSTVTVIVFFLGLVLVLIWKRQRRGSVKFWKGNEVSLVSFGYKDLQIVTKSFSEKLGGGGFGSVFKGTLPDSTLVAVKILERPEQGEKQFRAEVSTIGMIQHVNLVRLRGFCSESDKRLLVYDYMSNGSLDSHLFHQKDSKVLEWNMRYQIALGTARGLAYLHEKCRDCIIHCDIKPENILLDDEFCPMVADFGLAKLVGREFSRVLTTIRGTRGYLAPEWLTGVAITAKADVYSYGMMLFEIISGRRNSRQYEDGKVAFLPAWAGRNIAEGEDVLVLLDHRLEGNANVEELTRACRVACWCIQDNEAERPSMGQVVQILEGLFDVNLPPIPGFLQLLVGNHDNTALLTKSS